MVFKFGIIENTSNRGLNNSISKLKNLLSTIDKDINLLLFQDCMEKDFINNDDITKIKEYSSIRVNIFSDLANSFSIYLSPGILLEADQDNLYRSSVLFNPQGRLILKQRQIYIEEDRDLYDNDLNKKYLGNLEDLDLEKKLKIKVGTRINYTDIEAGKIAFMIDRDCWHPQIGRVMALEDVDIVLAVNNIKAVKNNQGLYNPWQQLAGVWSQVQQNQFIAMEASNGGQNLIHAPCEISPYRSGILAPLGIQKESNENNITAYFEVLSRNYKEINGFKLISTKINMDKLKEIRTSYPLREYLNKPLYCREIGGIMNVGKVKE